MEPKITFNNVSKSFNLYKKQSDKLLEVISLKNNKDNFYALKNISFNINEGEAIGIVGLNGSGKSTLSNLLAEVIPPTSGTLEVKGESSLIAISAGLNNQLTGLENIELKCLMHGLKKAEIEVLKSEIINFADIGKFIEQPVKSYSSGMKSRLGFAISVHTNPDILIVDEALSVGDQTFYEKCLSKINEFKNQGKTIVFISHSLSQIKAFCDRVMWIHYGRMEKFGETETVLKEYTEFIKWFNSLSEVEKKRYKSKLLDEQYRNESTNNMNTIGRQEFRKIKIKEKKKGDFSFLLQCILLFLAVIVSVSFMFGAYPVKGIESYFSEKTGEVEVKSEEKVEQSIEMPEEITVSVNNKGLVIAAQSVLYLEKELINSDGMLYFAEEILVIEQIGSAYKIKGKDDDKFYYTSAKNIQLVEAELASSQRTLTDFLPLFPNRFTNAYEYFLTFLNEEYEEVISTMIGSSEVPSEHGDRSIRYSAYDAEFIINNENIAESITINNIDIEAESWNALKDSAALNSNNNYLYLFILDHYRLILDEEKRQATISTLN